MNALLDFLLLPVLFFIGLVTAYQDFKEGKIRNKWVIFGLVWGVGIYFLFLIWALAVPYLSQIFSKQFVFILPSYIFKVFINSAIALIVGYLLWYFDLWSAGDAKLFFVFSLLLPLKYSWRTVLPYFPSFVLLINTFIPALLFLISQNLFYFLKSASIFKIMNFWKSNLLKLKTNYRSFLKTFLGFFLIFMIFQIIKLELKILINNYWQGIVFLLITLARKSLNKVFKKNWLLILLSLSLIFYLSLSCLFYSQPIFSKIALLIKDSFFFMIVFTIISMLISAVEGGQKKHLPFAVWMLIGVILTIILQGSLLHLVIPPLLLGS
jgi:hypothetical protein